VSNMPVRNNRSHVIQIHFDPVTTTGLRLNMKDVRAGACNPDIIELTWE